MRFPCVRFTVRALLLVNLSIAAALGLGLRSASLLRQASHHGHISRTLSRESEETAKAAHVENRPLSAIRPVSDDLSTGCDRANYKRSLYEGEEAITGLASYLGESASYHARLSQKYRLAATFPWLPVAPDPPEPK